MRNLKRILRRAMAALCIFTIIATSVKFSAVSFEAAITSDPYVTYYGERTDAVTLPQDGKMHLIAVADAADAAYRWQIRVPRQENYWVDIDGAHTDDLWVTYALVGSMLYADGSAQLRCRVTAGDTTLYTDPVTVTVSFSPNLNEPQPQYAEPTAFKRQTRAAENNNYGTHSIVINYLFENNALAFEPYGATVARGSDFSTMEDPIVSPTVVGYEPFCLEGDSYVDASKLYLDFKNIQEDIVINVVYKPALVKFSVHHHLQNLYDDGYSLNYDFITTSQAVTGTVVGDGLALTEEQLPGFRALAYEKLAVAADGSTVIEIRYDRNYYLVDFDMNGGYGTEPIYTRYGTPVGANDPIRHGYVFDGWDLVSYGGENPTTEQASQYAISATKTINVPAANLRYRARWITQNTTYTVVFWKENADDNGYSYWGYLDNQSALSGSTVSAQDWVSKCASITDEQYFTFNSIRSDKNVLIEGDGSTVINVYYTRNYYTITFKGTDTYPGTSCIIPTSHTHTDECYDTICGHKQHTHTAECLPHLICTTPEHTAHTADCIICSIDPHVHNDSCACKVEAHTHVKDCWSKANKNATNKPSRAPSNPDNAEVYKSGNSYYIYLFGSWYRYNAQNTSSGDIADPDCQKSEHTHDASCSCKIQEHTHAGSCYRDVLHTHDVDCYSYSCTAVDEPHEDECYRLICPYETKHTHSTNCKNTIKVVRRKYQQSIADLWPVVDANGFTFDNGERWNPNSYYSNVLVYLAKMPPANFSLTVSKVSYDTFNMHYYMEALPGEDYDVTVDNKNYKLDFVVKANYNYITKQEDFFDITGFTQGSSSPAFKDNQIDINGGGNVYFYYNRSANTLTFSNYGDIVENKTVNNVQYEAPLKQYYFVPDYPATLETGAYTFGGWYTSPGCFPGTEVDWDTICMADGGMQLYAKWSPITHHVRVFKDASLTEQIGQEQIVDHKAFAHAPEGNIVNGNYVFQGWFYRDSATGEEKAFVFTGIPITKNMDIYAKWSSHISVGYRIEYRLLTTGESIADPTIGTAIAGHNKTFPAKAGSELYAGYQSGFYPMVNSHTVTMSAEGDHTFTFYYVYKESVPYKVRYVDEISGQELASSKTVADNTLSVVTETFVRVDGKMSDAYQKRLVLVAEGTDADNDGILDENTITFYYNSDEEHAYYRVVHYVQSIDGSEYLEYRSQETVGNIGTVYTIHALTLTGFTFDGALTRVNGVSHPVTGTEISTTLGANGLLVELYYPRDTVPYVVRYLDNTTGEEIYRPYHGSGVFGQQVAESAVDLTGLGYTLIGEDVRLLTLSANADYNVLEFRYQERTVSLKYQLVGPTGCGSLSQTSQNIKAISGVPDGSMPYVSDGFFFAGWYLDAACTIPVPASWVNADTNRLVPAKTGDVWTDTTYYAKVISMETNLTIRVNGADNRDSQQSFLFRVVGTDDNTKGVDLTVSVLGNGSVTITQLPTGNYTITELTDWSWRYDADASRTVALEYAENGTEIVFEQNRSNGLWLDGNADNTNLFN